MQNERNSNSFAGWVLRLMAGAERAGPILGDLLEIRAAERIATGRIRSAIWFWWHLFASVPPLAVARVQHALALAYHYCRAAFRAIRKHPGYALINLAGLATGLGAALLISLWIQDELQYDRYHEKRDRVYRIVRDGGAKVGAKWGPALEAALPEIERAARFFVGINNQTLVEYEERAHYEPGFAFADPAVFELFSWPMVRGDSQEALTAPYSVVITASAARKYFGDGDPMGQTLRVDGDQQYRVTGVLDDIPRQSHFRFDFLGSFSTLEKRRETGAFGSPLSWTNRIIPTYFLFSESADVRAADAKLPAFIRQNLGSRAEQFVRHGYRFQSLKDIYLYPVAPTGQQDIATTGSAAVIWLFAGIAALIVLVAVCNFMNLATARSQDRVKEIGVRKVLGAGKSQLIRQFLGEAVLLSFAATVCALLLAQLALPAFRDFTGKPLTLGFLSEPVLMFAIIGSAVVVGLLAGSYPAFYLSRFRPAVTLKSVGGPGGSSRLRKGLVLFQFAISFILIASTMTAWLQLDYMRSKSLGFQAAQMLVLPFRGSDALRERAAQFKERVLRHSDIIGAAGSHSLPGHFLNGFAYVPEGGDPENPVSLGDLVIDHDFLDVYGIELVAGRGFNPALGSDSSGFVLNERAAGALGWNDPADAIGKKLTWLIGGGREGKVIGVVRDFHYRSLHEQIPTMVLHLTDWPSNFLTVRVRPERVASTLRFLESEWKRFEPVFPFQYYFMDAAFARRYGDDARQAGLFANFALLAVFISCLGLLGLVAFTASRRMREIGIRKVLGASAPGVVLLLGREFFRIVLIAICLAVPVAWILLRQWLDNFAYRIELTPAIFLAAGLSAFVIAAATVSLQAFRAARMNPVQALHRD